MRACLESHFATNDQKKLMAAAIALHSVQLATNSNGALLLTWFLDTCTFPRRRSVLAPRLMPHLVHLCTHKVAYLTVLKVINQRNEADARDSILRAIFFDDQTLTNIVSDQTCGATFIFKVLTTPFLDDSIRPECLENVRGVLLRLKAQPSQGYKRLMDEVGLSTRHGSTPVSNEAQNGFGRPPYSTMTPQQQGVEQGISPHLQRTVSMDSTSFDPYMTPQYTHSPAMSTAGVSPINPQQMQYQQAMMAQAQAQGQRAPGFYGSPGGMNPMTSNMPYGTASPASQMMDPYRQNSPMVPPGMGGFPQQQQQQYGAPPQMMGMNGYPGQYNMPPQYYPQQGPMQGQMQGQMGGGGGGGNRRGREISRIETYQGM
ncbi:ARM repeat-containing protein [Hortaea werneckii]|nr:ARM repeat-containing protein [Hortaea werneckii]